MRPQQQNRRMRGRNNNNNNRKGPNPLTRNYESNGPDVKIRGSAQQIAEKYTTLARDAQSSGDRVMAENYLQHAEHYNRIIAAAQAQMPIQQAQQNRDDFDDDLDDERDEFESGNGGEAATGNGSGPQPVIEGMPAEVALTGEAGSREGSREGREGNRHHRDRRHNGHQNGQRGNGQEARSQDGAGDERRETAGQAQPSDAADGAAEPADLSPAGIVAQVGQSDASGEETQPRRGRRPRRSRTAQGEEAGSEVPAASDADEAPAPIEN